MHRWRRTYESRQGIGCDGTYAYIGSIGLPAGTVPDQTMNGITSTNLQIPTAQDF